MQQWEYIGVRLIPEADAGRITVLDPLNLKGTPLNELGRQGWEVVGVFRDNFWVLLKRPLASAAGKEAPATQQASVETLVAPRGAITDRNGVQLAISQSADDIVADPYLIKQPQSAAAKLAPLLGKSPEAVLTKLTKPHTGHGRR